MPSPDHRVIIACAGSGKTTRLVRDALAHPKRRIAIITYTNNNLREIVAKFGQLNSGVPGHVDVLTWYSFLLGECARPYQRSFGPQTRIASLAFVNQRSTRGVSASDTRRYYFTRDSSIYSDKLSQFVIECERISNHAVTRRLREIYSDLYIDEFQDLAGWDWEVIKALLESKLRLTMVGDPRQHIYATNPSPKNRQFLGDKVVDLVRRWQRQGLCECQTMTETHRCSEEICAFSNSLWPGLPPMHSLRPQGSNHCGVFLVAQDLVPIYLERFHPMVLRNDRRAKTYGADAVNFRQSKGLQFQRVLIVPTDPIRRYLRTGNLEYLAKGRNRLHVAITRAWDSVAFVFDGETSIVKRRWTP